MTGAQSHRLLYLSCTLVVMSLTGCAEFQQWMHNGYNPRIARGQ